MSKNTKDLDFSGKLVYLTQHVQVWLKQVNPVFNVPMSGRIAKVVKVFDWSSPEGKKLAEARKQTNKWGKYNHEDFKFVLKVYYPELAVGSQDGLSVEEVLPRFFPGMPDIPMFELLQDSIVKDLMKAEEDIFKVVEKSDTKSHNKKRAPSRNVSNRVRKKSR